MVKTAVAGEVLAGLLAQLRAAVSGAAGDGVLRRDGDLSPSRGPCACGYRHWFEGREYDFVFDIRTTKGPLKLAVNANGDACFSFS